MKKGILTAMASLAAVLLLVSCAGKVDAPGAGGEKQTAATLAGVIVALEEGSVLVAPEDGGICWVNRDGALTGFDDAQLAPGTRISVGFGGDVMESYPAQIADVETVELKEGDDLAGLYLEVIDALWKVDSGLNGGAEYLAFNLSACDNLTAGEREAVVWMAASERGLTPLTGTFDELVEQGYIDGEALYFEDGLLISFSNMEFSDRSFRFDAQKWRSGLGAYFFTDCTAKLGSDGWNYEIGGEAIS